jgi:acetolactate synthase-1/2/3 large subunit
LVKRGIGHVFTLPGGMIAPLLDSLHRHGTVRIVTMHHEQAAAFAADGIGRYSGHPAVALATVGPGATNLLTGIASCYYDSVPALFITGQVQSYLAKGNRPVRQFGFQECDIVAMASPIVKAALQPRRADETPEAMNQAYRLAVTGRPGPVLIELPVDLQAASLREVDEVDNPAEVDQWIVQEESVEKVLLALSRSERPVVLAGGGVRSARAHRQCRELVRRLGTPLAGSIVALDVLPANDPLRLGMIGMYGNRWVNLAVAECDCFVVLGSRLEPGTISADTGAWRKARPIFQVDCDPGEMLRIKGAHTIQADVGDFLERALQLTEGVSAPRRDSWFARIAELRRSHPDVEELAGCDGINPNVLMRQLSAASSDQAAFVLDAGQHLWWACQSLQPRASQRIIPATGLGAMGFSLPAAIGIASVHGIPVVAVVGDGALQINIQELQTIVRNRLPIKIVVVNNRCHGAVRQHQEQAFQGRYPATVWGYDAPDFERVACAYGICASTLTEPEDSERALRWLWQEPEQPALLQVMISTSLNVYPNVPFGSPIHTMESQPRVPDKIQAGGGTSGQN